MYSIIPLAGPDFFNEKYGFKPLFKINNETLLKSAINSRKWIKDGEIKDEDIIFVLKTSKYLDEFRIYLKQKFPKAKIVEISDFTKGALMSCLAATSLITDFNKPIAFDLVDILFDIEISIVKEFEKDKNLGAILPVFECNNMQYSYADIDENGFVLTTKEKKGWNFNGEKKDFGYASTGVYFFRNLSVFLKSTSYSVKNHEIQSYNDKLFLCPAINGVIKNGFSVIKVDAKNVNSCGLEFK